MAGDTIYRSAMKDLGGVDLVRFMYGKYEAHRKGSLLQRRDEVTRQVLIKLVSLHLL
jgi:hypothetical protein